MKTFIQVTWHHDLVGEPVEIISEIDSGIERRKIEVYRDGKVGFADSIREVRGSILSEGIMPTLEETNAQDEFTGKYITESEFEELWSRYVSTAEEDIR